MKDRTSLDPPGQTWPSSDYGPEELEMLMLLELYRREITAKDLGLSPGDVGRVLQEAGVSRFIFLASLMAGLGTYAMSFGRVIPGILAAALCGCAIARVLFSKENPA